MFTTPDLSRCRCPRPSGFSLRVSRPSFRAVAAVSQRRSQSGSMPHSKPSFDEYAFSSSTSPQTAFPILRTNSYGRMMICAQMNTHDRLIRNARGRTDCFISKANRATNATAVATLWPHTTVPSQFAEDQIEYNRMLEKWRPGYNELQRKVDAFGRCVWVVFACVVCAGSTAADVLSRPRCPSGPRRRNPG